MDNSTNADAQQVVEKIFPGDPLAAEMLGTSQPLGMGSRGKDVRMLQEQLLQLGFLKGGLNGSADGIFGPGTRAAVQAFQQSAQLDADGVVGPVTRVALQQAAKNTFRSLNGSVKSIAISQDGRRLVVGLDNGTVQLLDLYSGTLVGQAFQAHEGTINSVAFSPNGHMIASVGAEAKVRLWTLEGKLIKESANELGGGLGGEIKSILSVAFSPQGDKLATGRDNHTVSIDDIPFFSSGRLLSGHEDQVTTVTFSPDGKTIASGSNDGTVRLWDLEGNTVGEPFQGKSSICSIAFSPNQQAIAVGDSDGKMHLWHFKKNEIYSSPESLGLEHEGGILSVAFSPDGQTIASSGNSKIHLWYGEIGYWSRLPAALRNTIQVRGTVWTLAFSRDSKFIVAGTSIGAIHLWEVKTRKEVSRLPNNVGQELENDLPQGEDRLNVKNEIDALTNVLMLRDLKPPLAVGILGGWGSGKSFGLHLMKRRINEIRSEALTENQSWGNEDQLFPYVGHIYQIEFDAWTYAKSNLWASLMQKIFFELNRQISLEQKLKVAKVDLLKGGQIWKALNNMSDEHRRQILESHLTPEIFREPDLYKRWMDIESSQRISSVLWERLGKLQQDEVKKLREEQVSLLEGQNELSKKQIAIETKVDQKIREDSRALFWKPLSDDLSQVMGTTFKALQSRLISKDDADKVKIILEELEPDLWQSLLKTFRRNPIISVLFIASLVLLTSFPWLITQLNNFFSSNISQGYLSGFLRVLTTSPAVIFGISFFQKAWSGWKRYRKQIEQILKRYQNQVLDKQEELIQSRQALVEIEKSKDTELAQLEEKTKQQQAHIEQQQQRISLTTNYKSLNDLIDARLRADPYSEQLGLLQQVKGDIEELTDCLVIQSEDPEHIKQKKLELFPRGPARVVLYIDDLDRCPPNKVVEVLEAVQLLVKTSLFIVVLAIDDRYISRALEDVYKGVLKRRGEPSGIDYLEKIIQIPYRMRPISPSGLKSYLEFQMKVEEDDQVAEDLLPNDEGKDSATTGARATVNPPQGVADPDPVDTTPSIVSDKISEIPKIPDAVSEVIKFSRSEFELLTNCCKHVDLSPRTAKRLINIYKILKIVWSRYPSLGLREPQAQTKQVVISLLALSGRYPNFTRHLFEEIDTQFEELSNADDNNVVLTCTLTNLLKALYQQVPTHDHYYQREWRKFTHDIVQMLKSPRVKDSDNQVNESSVPSAEIFSEISGDSLSIDRETFYLALSFCFVGNIGYDPDDYHLGSKPNFQSKLD